MLRALWLVVAHVPLEYRYMDNVKGNSFSLFCSIENVWEIISEQVKASKKFSRSYVQRRKIKKRKQKSSWQLDYA